MCGIAGILSGHGTPVSEWTLYAMTDSISHRGPDDAGHFIDSWIALGHRRLSIIDLSAAAHQPMQTPDGRYVLSYNGEIYNYRALRRELEQLGWKFRSVSDTEVVLYALVEWGTDALLKFDGMFALALWDTREKELLLARDRFGIKPLYLAWANDVLVFASEIKALLASSYITPAVDVGALAEYMTFQNFLTERTLFAGVDLLPHGSFCRAVACRVPTTHRYWDYDFVGGPPSDRAQHTEELVHLFEAAVRRQMVSDVPVGAYLSGGIDSGAITAVAATHADPLRTFTVGFDQYSASGLELALDERPAAEHMSYLFGTEHYEMVLKAGDMERCMQTLVWHLEEPRVGQSYPNFYAAKLASRFGKVVLGGTGGDEMFGGYPWRYYRAVVNDDFDHYIDKYFGFWQRLVDDDEYRKVLGPILGDNGIIPPKDLFRQVFSHHADALASPEDFINHSLYFEAKTFLHGLLVVEDKLSMAHSLESRVPFLDNALVDFAMRTPVAFKLGNLGEVVKLNENEPGDKTRKFFERTRDGKLILREALSRFVPGEVSERVKQGFSAPDAKWFRGESIEYVRAKLLTPSARVFDFVDAASVRGLIEEHLSGRQNRRLLIWSLLYLEEWLDCFLGAGVTSVAAR